MDTPIDIGISMLRAVLLFIILFGSGTSTTAHPPPEYLARSATVMVIVESVRTGGVLIAPDRILTVKHGLRGSGSEGGGGDEATIIFYTERLTLGSFALGSVIWRSENIDLALLSIPPIDIPPIVLSCTVPQLGSHIFTIGHSEPGPVFWTLRSGWVASSDRDPVGSMLLYIHVVRGNSGGGVFDYEGRLVGIVEAVQIITPDVKTGFTYMVPGNVICSELDKWKKGEEGL